MKILITGANGFVGNHLTRALVSSGHSVVLTGTESSELHQNYPYMQADLTNKEDVGKIDFSEINGVVHLAGLAAVGPSFDNPQLYLDVNMGAELNLLEEIISQKASPRFLVVSSGMLYDPNAGLPLSERSSVKPNSPYAVSKLGQEQLAQYYTSRGLECIIARPFNHIGPGQNEGFIVPDLAKQIIEGECGLRDAVMVGNLHAKRDYTDVRDIVRAYELLLLKGRPGEVYNICSGHPVEGVAILNGLLSLSKREMIVEHDPTRMRPSDTPEIYGSYSKLTQDTGWEPTIPLSDTLRDVLDDWRKRIKKEA